MKTIIALSIALATLTAGQTTAQETPATKAGKKEMSGPGVKKRGTGKVGPDATQNGNMSDTDTRVKFTAGSTSEGSASTPVPGGAKGTNTVSKRKTTNSNASTVSTSGETGSQRPTSAAAVEKEAKTSDKNVSTGYPQPTSVKQPGNAMSPRQKVRANTKRGMGQQPDTKSGDN